MGYRGFWLNTVLFFLYQSIDLDYGRGLELLFYGEQADFKARIRIVYERR